MMARTRMVTVETEITGWILNLGSRGLGSHVGHVGERMMPSLCLEQLRGPVDCYGKLRMGRKINKSTLDVLKCLSESKMDTSNMYLICESRLRN